MPEPVVLLAREGGVATLTLNRPQALNALDRDLTLGPERIDFFRRDGRAIRCVVLRGGEHFMAGGDLKWFRSLLRGQVARGEPRAVRGLHPRSPHAIILALRRMPKPVLASVRGAVAGFGMSLMMATDLALASDNAYFTLAYTLIGVSPTAARLSRCRASSAKRRRWRSRCSASASMRRAAERLGLVNRVIPSAALEVETSKLPPASPPGPPRSTLVPRRS
jgi:2-(1,2-epoxy-1,2-dihydrophenyl)acetyl-CoA isomerase